MALISDKLINISANNFDSNDRHTGSNDETDAPASRGVEETQGVKDLNDQQTESNAATDGDDQSKSGTNAKSPESQEIEKLENELNEVETKYLNKKMRADTMKGGAQIEVNRDAALLKTKLLSVAERLNAARSTRDAKKGHGK